MSNIELKVYKMINKINKEISFNFFKHKKIILVTISLFSDIKVGKKSNKYEVLFDINRLNSGTLYKYGNSFTNQKYFESYEANLIKKDDYEIKTINNVLENLHVNDAPNEPIKHSDETYYVIDSDKSDDYIKLE